MANHNRDVLGKATKREGDGKMPKGKPAKGLKAMTDEEVSNYMASLAAGPGDLQGVEVDVRDQLQKAINDKLQAEQTLKELAAQSERLQGTINALTKVLVSAEDNRRTKKE